MSGKSGLVMRQQFDYESWTYTYLLIDPETNEAVQIDSVKEQVERDLEIFDNLGIKVKYLLETHVHADHITGASDLRDKIGAQVVYGAGAKVPCSDVNLADGETVQFGKYRVKALSTPGHTDGCTSYVVENMVFTGDTLLIRGCGRTDFQQGSSELLYNSVNEKLFMLPDETLVYPAHDYKGRSVSSISEEKKFNLRLALDKTREQFFEIMDNLNLAKPKKIDESVPANMKCGKTD
jgi:sulfur dioxygenase